MLTNVEREGKIRDVLLLKTKWKHQLHPTLTTRRSIILRNTNLVIPSRPFKRVIRRTFNDITQQVAWHTFYRCGKPLKILVHNVINIVHKALTEIENKARWVINVCYKLWQALELSQLAIRF